MRFTDIFIHRPVLAMVVSLLILLLGARSLQEMQLRQYPEVKNTVITVTTAYPGAEADLINGFITTPLQQAIAGAEGIDYLTANSNEGISTIEAHIVLDFDPNVAMTQIMAKVAEVRNTLPPEAEAPIIQQTTGSGLALMYMSYYSDKMNSAQITDYLTRVVQPKLATLEGVAKAEILGGKTFAMRVWLNPDRMTALGITPTEVAGALRSNNYLAAAGRTRDDLVALSIGTNTDLRSAEEFRALVVRQDGDTLVRLRDVAQVELGAENYDSSVVFNGEDAVFIGISATPTANPLEVIDRVYAIMPEIRRQLPPTLEAKVVYDGSEYVRSAIAEVAKTIFEATLIVMLVIYLFLGSVRAVAVPVVTIPLSLIGVGLVMYAMGYSLNLLTLLAMVLAIGLVVDDAIVVVENIHRHIEEGATPFNAALQGAREIAGPIIAMTLTLAAVYAPIGFMGGVTGALFTEFALTLAGAVLVSGIIALTLSPMMCSRLLTPANQQGRFVTWLDHRFEALKARYQRLLHGALNYPPVITLFIVVVLVSLPFLYTTAQHELAPTEDQSVLFVSATGPQEATIDYMESFTRRFEQVYDSTPEKQDYFVVNGMGQVNNVISGFILKPWDQRERTQTDVQPEIQNGLAAVPGLKSAVFPLPSLPSGANGLPFQFVVTSTAPYRQLHEVSQDLLSAARASGLFIFLDTDLKYNKPKVELMVDRDKAAAIGLSMEEVGRALSTLLGGGYVNRFNLEGRAYKVIPQAPDSERSRTEQLQRYYVRAGNGELVPLSTVVRVKSSVEPNKLSQFQQLNSVTIQGVLIPGVAMGDGLAFMQEKAAELLPAGFGVDYGGESREFMQEGQALVFTFFFAILIIFLVLAAQFESFRDPIIILISVPMSLAGALIFLNLGFATVNIYTQVGLVTLIGLISKHGILIVAFANQLQRTGLSKRQAVEEAASIRLRPVLMTTAAMVMGVLPLILASGAGAESRYSIGLVIASGMLIGTLFTLFVVPAVYLFLARDHRNERSPEPATA